MSDDGNNFKIKQFPELVKAHLTSDKFFRSAKFSRLTAPGENYGSIMIKIDIKVVNRKTGMEELIYAVAKILPESEEFRKLFKVEETVVKEINFYEIIVPTLQNFQRDLGITEVIDCFYKCYASRKTLRDDSDVIDEDSVILLENLVESGFKNTDRLQGFDLETAKLVLKDLAVFHAVPLALKIKNPSVFTEKIKANCDSFMPGENDDDQTLLQILKAVLKEKNDCPQTAIDLISKKKEKPPTKEPYATLIHRDMWINNTMQKSTNGRAVANKLVDFQLYDYGSPAHDLVFFLWTSIPQSILESDLDHLIQYYHECFTHILEDHGCEISPFTYEKLLEEIKCQTESQFARCLFFILMVVHAKKGMGPPDHLPPIEEMVKDFPLVAKEKCRFMARECERRGWLDN